MDTPCHGSNLGRLAGVLLFRAFRLLSARIVISSMLVYAMNVHSSNYERDFVAREYYGAEFLPYRSLAVPHPVSDVVQWLGRLGGLWKVVGSNPLGVASVFSTRVRAQVSRMPSGRGR